MNSPQPLVAHRDTAAHLSERTSLPFTILPSWFPLFFPQCPAFPFESHHLPTAVPAAIALQVSAVPWPGREVSPSGSVWESSFQIQASNSHGSCSVSHTFPSQSTKTLIPQIHFLPGFSQHHQAMLNLSGRIRVLIQTPFCPGGSLASLFFVLLPSSDA